MRNLGRCIVSSASAALSVALISCGSGWAQTPAPVGNQLGSDAYQPTRGQTAAEERAAGISPSPAQQNTEQRELNQIYQSLMNRSAGSSAQPGAPPK
jgi:hypothetical protein